MKTLYSFLCVHRAAVSDSNSASHLKNDLFESYFVMINERTSYQILQ